MAMHFVYLDGHASERRHIISITTLLYQSCNGLSGHEARCSHKHQKLVLGRLVRDQHDLDGLVFVTQ